MRKDGQSLQVQLRSYAITTKGYEGRQIVYARSPGHAKSIHWLNISDLGIPFCALRAAVADGAEPTGFRNCAAYRGFNWVEIGQRVTVAGKWGTIVGSNSSANWNVLFDGERFPWNCHPRSEIGYYTLDGRSLIEAYDIRGNLILPTDPK